MIDFIKRIKNKRIEEDKGIPIQAEFIRETGRYSDEMKTYVDRHVIKKYKNIFVNICEDASGRLLLKFYGGPTGHECYLLDSILSDFKRWEDSTSDTLCICAGTINRWDACYVSIKDVHKFIKGVLGE